MKKQVLFILLILFGTGMVLVTCINFFSYMDKNKKSRQQLIKHNSYLLCQNNYLERCFKYRSSLNGNKIPTLFGKDIVVYFSGEICPSCVERLLHFLNNQDEIKKRTFILVNDSSKLDFIIGYNDAFQQNYDYLYDTTILLQPVNEILIF